MVLDDVKMMSSKVVIVSIMGKILDLRRQYRLFKAMVYFKRLNEFIEPPQYIIPQQQTTGGILSALSPKNILSPKADQHVRRIKELAPQPHC